MTRAEYLEIFKAIALKFFLVPDGRSLRKQKQLMLDVISAAGYSGNAHKVMKSKIFEANADLETYIQLIDAGSYQKAAEWDINPTIQSLQDLINYSDLPV